MSKPGSISKVTERGQITLPKHLRESGAFAGARAVMFIERGDSLIIEPVKVRSATQNSEHLTLLDATMAAWADPINDNLFDVSK